MSAEARTSLLGAALLSAALFGACRVFVAPAGGQRSSLRAGAASTASAARLGADAAPGLSAATSTLGLAAAGACCLAGLAVHRRKRQEGVTAARFFFGGGREPTPEDVTQQVYFDINIDGEPAGRIVFGLYGDVVPKTVKNFKTLCTALPGEGYKNCPFHRIIPGFMCQGGDYTNFNGTGGRSIYGNKFEDENFELNHTKPGLLSMANAGPNTNGSQFFITTAVTDWLNGKHVVFGEVMEGGDVLRKMESYGSGSGRTRAEVSIGDCGEL